MPDIGGQSKDILLNTDDQRDPRLRKQKERAQLVADQENKTNSTDVITFEQENDKHSETSLGSIEEDRDDAISICAEDSFSYDL